MKLCKNCKHYKGDSFNHNCHVRAYKKKCKVSGVVVTLGDKNAFAMRSKLGECGPEAKLFEKRSFSKVCIDCLRDPVFFVPLSVCVGIFIVAVLRSIFS